MFNLYEKRYVTICSQMWMVWMQCYWSTLWHVVTFVLSLGSQMSPFVRACRSSAGGFQIAKIGFPCFSIEAVLIGWSVVHLNILVSLGIVCINQCHQRHKVIYGRILQWTKVVFTARYQSRHGHWTPAPKRRSGEGSHRRSAQEP